MELTQFRVEDPSSILEQFLNGSGDDDKNETPSPASPSDNILDDLTPKQPNQSPAKDKAVGTAEEFLEDIKKEDVIPENEFFKSAEELYDVLIENNLAYLLEDGGKPKTKEELIDALKQSVDYNTNTSVDTLWKQKIDSLPENLLRIHEYAAQGITSAQELQQFMGAVSQNEAIASLDPTNPEHQERIALLQLLNTGTSEASAQAVIETLKEKDKLSSFVDEVYPELRKSYDNQVRHLELEKSQKMEAEEQYLQTNAVNVQYFLDEKNQDYLPFKVTSNKDKGAIYELAAQPVGVNEAGEAIYKWEQHIKALQFGDEKAYRKFMKIMTVMALDDDYDKKISKNGSSAANEANFKKISTTIGTKVNPNIVEQDLGTGVRMQKAAPRSPWSRGG